MPIVMYLVTMASRKWGNSFGGILASLPWVAGPILIFMAIEQGKDFVVSSLSGVMVGIIGWLIFCTSFILVGRKFNSLYSLLAGYIGYLCFGIIMKNILPLLGIYHWYCISFAAIITTLIFFPKVADDSRESKKTLKFDMLFRILMITSFVILITHFAKILGPEWSGILAPFPIMTAVLGIFVHYTQGTYQTRKLFYGMLSGAFGFITFLLLLYITLPQWSIFMSFFISLSINFCINFGINYFLLNRK